MSVYQFKKLSAFLTTLLFFALFAFSSSTSNALPQRVENSTVELLSDQQAIQPGQTFWVGWQINLDEGWHTYWKNPGDTGLRSMPTWTLPEGFTVTDFKWPTPHIIKTESLINYGYEGSVLLLSKATAPKNIKIGETIQLKLNVDYLICKDICLPVSAEMALEIPVAGKSVAQSSNVLKTFAASKQLLPQKIERVKVKREGEFYEITLLNDKIGIDALFIPDTEDLIKDNEEQYVFEKDGAHLTIKVMRDVYQDLKPENLGGLLVSQGKGYAFKAPVDVIKTASAQPKKQENITQDFITPPLLLILLFAFLAGLILNLMPCVLPVLSLKALGLIQHVHGGKGKFHALLFGFGVIASFWALAGTLLIIQNTGTVLGWGFHLQNPVFVSLLIFLLTLMALNFFGVFEIGTSLTRLGNLEEKHHGSAIGSFLSGVLVTIVATPCTVPFMGTAVAFALSQTYLITLLVFTVMGIGLALPYVLLAFIPTLVDHLPKPGNWMVTFRQFLGFPLLVTVLWLIWVYTNQSGVDKMVPLISGLLLAAFGAWLFGRFGTLDKPANQQLKIKIWFVILILVGWGLTNNSFGGAVSRFIGFNEAKQSSNWGPWSRDAVSSALLESKPVFLNFTADWCITCKVNERITLNAPTVQKLFKEKGVVLLKGDWTNKNEKIAHEITSFGRRGVPLYVYYDGKGNVEVLPQILTTKIIKDIL